MTTKRWRVRALMGLVCIIALAVKGVLLVRPRPDAASGPGSALARLTELQPRPTFVEPALVAALNDSDAGVRHTAVWALDQIGSTSPSLVRVLVENLEAETEQSLWKNRWDPEQVNPTDALKRIRLPAEVIAPLFRKAMGSKERWVRLQATEVLCEAARPPGSPALIPLLLTALQDEEAKIRMRAAAALALLDGDPRQKAVTILLEQLRRLDRPAQLLTTIGLAHFGPEGRAAGEILADRLQDGDVTNRLLDLYLIGRLGPVAMSTVRAVVRAMTSGDAEQNIPFFLNGFVPEQGAWHSAEIDMILDSEERSQSPSSLCILGAVVLGRISPEAERQAVDSLIEMLGSEDELQRSRAVDALGALGTKASGASPTLLALTERKKFAPPRDDDKRAVIRIRAAMEKIGRAAAPDSRRDLGAHRSTKGQKASSQNWPRSR